MNLPIGSTLPKLGFKTKELKHLLLTENLDINQIAKKMDLSLSRTKYYLNSLYKAYGVKNKYGLVFKEYQFYKNAYDYEVKK
jgi:DNA-binding CsgD family transcriptional regulator